jgi:hypothetical protein
MVVINLNKCLFVNYGFLFSIHIGKKKRQHETILHGLILYCIRNHVGAKNELPLDGRKKSP